MSHWAIQYIGKPWVVGARGPESYDCFGLLWHVYKHQFGIELPNFADFNDRDLKRTMVELSRAEKSGDWQRIETPVDGCAVGLSTNELFHHVGVFLAADGGNVLHALDKKNVILTPVSRLRAEGFKRVEFFVHKSHAAHC